MHVEAEWNPADPVGETRWLADISDTCQHPVVFVVQARLEQYDIEEVLAGHSPFPQVRGIRHKPTATTQNATKQRGLPGSMDDPKWRKGYALLERFEYSFDLQIPYWHLDQAAELATDFPDTEIIINHAGLPIGRSDSSIREWRKAIKQVADHQNVTVKLSGLGNRINHGLSNLIVKSYLARLTYSAPIGACLRVTFQSTAYALTLTGSFLATERSLTTCLMT